MASFKGRNTSFRQSAFACTVMILTVISLPVWAQTDSSPSDSDVVEMEEVIVTATRTEEELLEVPQHVTVITEEEIRASGAANIAEVIEEKAGMSISDYGPEGSQKSVSLQPMSISTNL